MLIINADKINNHQRSLTVNINISYDSHKILEHVNALAIYKSYKILMRKKQN